MGTASQLGAAHPMTHMTICKHEPFVHLYLSNIGVSGLLWVCAEYTGERLDIVKRHCIGLSAGIKKVLSVSPVIEVTEPGPSVQR